MLTLSTACQVKPIRIGVSYDSANEKERLSVLKEMHAHSHWSASKTSYVSGGIFVLKQKTCSNAHEIKLSVTDNCERCL